MRRLVAVLMVCACLAVFGGAGVVHADVGVGASLNLTWAQCCSIAANNYLAAKQQPPSLTNVGNARAAQRNSINSGRVDSLLRPYWPGGIPMLKSEFPSAK